LTIVNRPFPIDNSSGACTPAASHPANASSGTLTAEEWQDNLFRLSNPVSAVSSALRSLCALLFHGFPCPAFPLRFLCSPSSPADDFASTLGVELFARFPELSLKISDMSLHCIRSYSRSGASCEGRVANNSLLHPSSLLRQTPDGHSHNSPLAPRFSSTFL